VLPLPARQGTKVWGVAVAEPDGSTRVLVTFMDDAEAQRIANRMNAKETERGRFE
jgi:hypothetical protein